MSQAAPEGLVQLSDVRLSFPHLVEPQRNVNPTSGRERISYNAEAILPPTHPGWTAFMNRVGVIATDKWKQHAATVLQLIQQDRKSRCYGDGSEKINKRTFLPYDGYVGMYYIGCGKDTPPQIYLPDGSLLDPNNTMVYQQQTRKMYGGCRVNMAVKPWAQENEHGRGIRCDLIAIQFLRDDTPFGEGAVDASGMFGAVVQAPAAAAPAAPMPGAPFFGAPAAAPAFGAPAAAPSFGSPAGLPSFLK